MSDTNCVMPSLGLAIQNNGDFCACNLNNWSYTDNKLEPLFAYKNTLEQAWASPTRKMITIALEKGRVLDSCQVCHDVEKSGRISVRQSLNQVFADVNPLPDQPKVMIIKPSNVCNLACRMCNPETSTGWYKDSLSLARIDNPEISDREFFSRFNHIRDGLSDRNTEFWNTMKQWLPNFEFMDIYGGEPFLATALFDALKHTADAGNAGSVSLRLHTNATILNQDYLNVLTKFKFVNIGLSIDSHVPEQVEYIRYPVKHNELVANIKTFVEWASQHKNISVSATVTVTTFNVFYIDEILKQISQLGLPATLNFVTTPGEYDARHIPVDVKHKLLQHIQNTDVKKFVSQTIPGCDYFWPRFWKVTQQLDQLRNQDFAKVFPEFYKLINGA